MCTTCSSATSTTRPPRSTTGERGAGHHPSGAALEMWPEDRAAFDEYWNAQLEKVNIDDAVRDYLIRSPPPPAPHSRSCCARCWSRSPCSSPRASCRNASAMMQPSWGPVRQAVFISMAGVGLTVGYTPRLIREFPFERAAGRCGPAHPAGHPAGVDPARSAYRPALQPVEASQNIHSYRDVVTKCSAAVSCSRADSPPPTRSVSSSTSATVAANSSPL